MRCFWCIFFGSLKFPSLFIFPYPSSFLFIFYLLFFFPFFSIFLFDGGNSDGGRGGRGININDFDADSVLLFYQNTFSFLFACDMIYLYIFILIHVCVYICMSLCVYAYFCLCIRVVCACEYVCTYCEDEKRLSVILTEVRADLKTKPKNKKKPILFERLFFRIFSNKIVFHRRIRNARVNTCFFGFYKRMEKKREKLP